MEMEKYSNEFLGEEYYKINHDSGLTIYVMPKKNMKSCYAIFGTDYGSVDISFSSGGEETNDVPEGIAHFLEHKLFESEELGAFELYAKTGASANAYTSFDKTCYLFSCTDNFDESLKILLDFVKHPYFTQETVDKEQGIIGQEIEMYRDNPDWQVLFNLLKALYHKNPVRTDIAGTKESIAKIDAGLLYKCYNTFYNLNNMGRVAAGPVTVQQVIEAADEKIKPEEPVEIIRNTVDEPENIVTGYTEQDMHVGVKKFNLGFREKIPGNELKYSIAISVAFDLICGKTTDFYDELLNEELINSDFGTEFFRGRGFAVNIFGGESSDPEKLRDKILGRLRFMKKNGIDEEEFEAIRRKKYGAEVRCFNDIDALANALVVSHFEGTGLFDVFEIYRSLTKDDIENVIKESFDERLCSLSVIK